jgi:adenosine deaminase
MSLADVIHRAPKALLHDHLDGGVRPQTVVELAQEFGYKDLPTTDVDDLATWFNRGAKRNDLVLYLETFAHTVGVMQDRDAIERVAYECARISPPTVSCTPRSASPQSSAPRRA